MQAIVAQPSLVGLRSEAQVSGRLDCVPKPHRYAFLWLLWVEDELDCATRVGEMKQSDTDWPFSNNETPGTQEDGRYRIGIKAGFVRIGAHEMRSSGALLLRGITTRFPHFGQAIILPCCA